MIADDLWAAAQSGADALLAARDDDGLVGGESILDYYKAPWALVTAGRPREAEAVLEAAVRRSASTPGQFHDGDDRPELLRSSTYRNVFLMQAAALLSRFDLCGREARADLLSRQHPGHGGFFGEQDRSVSREMNTNHSSMAGLFCLQAGLGDAALAAADYVLVHLEQQPDLERRLYIHTDTNGRLLTDVDQRDRAWRVLDFSDPETHFWAIGTPAAFLATLAEYSGERRYLDAASRLLGLADRLADGWESWASAGKIAWGAARMYRATGDAAYRELAERVASSCFLDQQRADGRWGPFRLRMGDGDAGYSLPELELTSEFTLLCADVSRCLAR